MSHHSLFSALAVSAMLVSGLFAQDGRPAAEVDFANDILPILSNKCFVCHGPDSHDDTDLKLDSFAAATVDLGGYRAVDPDAPAKSELLIRVESTDDPMPPLDADKQLTPGEKGLLRAWIEQGGNYAEHWAFVPPEKRAPDVADNEVIDALIETRLKRAALSFAPEAPKEILARRAALVLTGLPPAPEQLTRFLADDQPLAYERFVDELMSSPGFGEHQARYWLDAVRYGDTHGLHLDNRRGIYPYRDWVVRAFNQNLPLDKFITWQLAGDLLPDPTLEQLVATGFVRMNPSTAEGGAIPEEFQAKNNFDRTETLGTVLLGMTLTCARCHSHKYDPISQTEYYQLFAFFNSTAEHSMDGNSYTYGPVVEAPQDQAAWAEWEQLQNTRKEVLRDLSERAAQTETLLEYARNTTRFTTSQWRISPVVEKDAEPPADSEWSPLEGLPGVIDTKLPGETQSRWLSFTLEVKETQTIVVEHSGADGSLVFVNGNPLDPPRDLDLRARSYDIRIKLVGSQSEPGIRVRLSSPWQPLVDAGSWQACSEDDQIRMGHDVWGPLFERELTRRASDYVITAANARARYTTTLVARDLPQPRPTYFLRRGEYNLPVGDPLSPGILSVMGAFPDEAPRNRLGLAQWLTSRDHPLVSRVLANQLWQRVFGVGLVRTPEDFGLQGERPTHPQLLDWLAVELQDSGWDMKHVLRLMVTSRTFRQSSARRPGVDDPENRLFARGPRYRMDAEVLRDIGLWASGLLNRQMGGEGVKPYQPAGMWLAMAHPGSNTKQYVRDQGERLYHRSLYVYWKRTSPHPMMTLFDAPDRESSCVRRSRTTTPLQSLGLLNETQRVEMSRKLAERLLTTSTQHEEQLDQLFQLLACRKPTAPERAACDSLYQTMLARYQDSTEDALALLSIGDAPRDESLDVATLAAWTQVANTVLASDLAILLY